jgi:hypothetical protein
MCVGFLTADTWSSSRPPPDSQFETDRLLSAAVWATFRAHVRKGVSDSEYDEGRSTTRIRALPQSALPPPPLS